MKKISNKNYVLSQMRNNYFSNDENWERLKSLFKFSPEEEKLSADREAMLNVLAEKSDNYKLYSQLRKINPEDLINLARSLENFKSIDSLCNLQVLCLAAIIDDRMAMEKWVDGKLEEVEPEL